MTITKAAEADKLELKVAGRLDTSTAPQLEKELSESLTGVKELVMDFQDLEYISSAGLRVLLSAQVNEIVMEIFEVTGFSDILTIA